MSPVSSVGWNAGLDAARWCVNPKVAGSNLMPGYTFDEASAKVDKKFLEQMDDQKKTYPVYFEKTLFG